jgi:hypothetical protein
MYVMHEMNKNIELPKNPTSPNSISTEEDDVCFIKAEVTKTSMTSISEEYRREMIAIGAYYWAEQRGFAPGYEEFDWLTAEAEINAYIK